MASSSQQGDGRPADAFGCPVCSTELPENALFCSQCGHSLSEPTVPTNGSPPSLDALSRRLGSIGGAIGRSRIEVHNVLGEPDVTGPIFGGHAEVWNTDGWYELVLIFDSAGVCCERFTPSRGWHTGTPQSGPSVTSSESKSSEISTASNAHRAATGLTPITESGEKQQTPATTPADVPRPSRGTVTKVKQSRQQKERAAINLGKKLFLPGVVCFVIGCIGENGAIKANAAGHAYPTAATAIFGTLLVIAFLCCIGYWIFFFGWVWISDMNRNMNIVRQGVPSPQYIAQELRKEWGREPTVVEVQAVHQMLTSQHNQAMLNAGISLGALYLMDKNLHDRR